MLKRMGEVGVLGACLVLWGACATSSSVAPAGAVLTAEELTTTGSNFLFDGINSLHPEWMKELTGQDNRVAVVRREVSGVLPPVRRCPVGYVGRRAADLNELRQIRIRRVAEVRFFRAGQPRRLSSGCTNPMLQVILQP